MCHSLIGRHKSLGLCQDCIEVALLGLNTVGQGMRACVSRSYYNVGAEFVINNAEKVSGPDEITSFVVV